MIDYERVRQGQEKFRQAIADKGVPLDFDAWLLAYEQQRRLRAEVDGLRQKRNQLTERIAAARQSRPAEAPDLVAEARGVGQQLALAEEHLRLAQLTLNRLDDLLPGLPDPEAPPGFSDADNVEVRRFGLTEPAPGGADHLELMLRHKMVDLGLREMAGSRAYALIGLGALLELAVLRLALDLVLSRGFTPVLPPLMVRAEAMRGTGYFPLGEDNAYQLEKDGLFLTGTSEVGMVAMLAGRLMDEGDLPLRMAGISPCFRREAGSAGRDVRGLYRVHQFQKVEQVVVCGADEKLARAEHLALLANSEDILQALELPYRVVKVCRGEMGLGQTFKHDIETWMPSRNAYGETHSCSSFEDFQGRRLNIRYKDNQGKKKFVYTLNNTAIASPRILIPLLEVHQKANGTIRVPEALRPYLGRDLIGT